MFYFLRQNLFADLGMIEIVGHTDVTGSFPWVDGVRFDRAVPREVLMLNPEYGANFPDYFDTSIPVMSKRMVAALASFGVANLDTYDVVLRNSVDGSERDDYVAVNLIGRVAAVDLAQSPHRLRFGKPYFTGSISIDATKLGGLDAFRLTYGPSFIVVTESLAKKISGANLSAVLLQPTTDYGGT